MGTPEEVTAIFQRETTFADRNSVPLGQIVSKTWGYSYCVEFTTLPVRSKLFPLRPAPFIPHPHHNTHIHITSEKSGNCPVSYYH